MKKGEKSWLREKREEIQVLCIVPPDSTHLRRKIILLLEKKQFFLLAKLRRDYTFREEI